MHERWDRAEEAQRKYFDVANRCLDVLRKLPDGKRKGELQTAYDSYERQGKDLMKQIVNSNASSVEQKALRDLIDQFEGQLQGDAQLADRLIEMYRQTTDERRSSFDDAVLWMQQAENNPGDQQLHNLAAQKAALEIRNASPYVERELKYLTENAGEAQRDRIAELQKWKTEIEELRMKASETPLAVAGMVTAATGERAALIQNNAPGEVNTRDRDVVSIKQKGEEKLGKMQENLVKKINSEDYKPSQEQVQQDLDTLKEIARAWQKIGPQEKAKQELEAMRPAYNKLRKIQEQIVKSSTLGTDEIVARLETNPTIDDANELMERVSAEEVAIRNRPDKADFVRSKELEAIRKKWGGFAVSMEGVQKSSGFIRDSLQSSALLNPEMFRARIDILNTGLNALAAGWPDVAKKEVENIVNAANHMLARKGSTFYLRATDSGVELHDRVVEEAKQSVRQFRENEFKKVNDIAAQLDQKMGLLDKNQEDASLLREIITLTQTYHQAIEAGKTHPALINAYVPDGWKKSMETAWNTQLERAKATLDPVRLTEMQMKLKKIEKPEVGNAKTAAMQTGNMNKKVEPESRSAAMARGVDSQGTKEVPAPSVPKESGTKTEPPNNAVVPDTTPAAMARGVDSQGTKEVPAPSVPKEVDQTGTAEQPKKTVAAASPNEENALRNIMNQSSNESTQEASPAAEEAIDLIGKTINNMSLSYQRDVTDIRVQLDMLKSSVSPDELNNFERRLAEIRKNESVIKNQVQSEKTPKEVKEQLQSYLDEAQQLQDRINKLKQEK